MTRVIPRVVALLATYNEERFVAGCLEHLLQQHVDVYLIDNCSSDQTVAIASRYMGRGLIGIEATFHARGCIVGGRFWNAKSGCQHA